MNNTINGECSKCGGCCGRYLPLTNKDIQKVKYIVKTKGIQPQRAKITVFEDLTCPFLTKDRKCIIYNHRPYICQIYQCNKHGNMTQEEAQYIKNATPWDMWDFFNE